jgi:predicted peptidase
MKKSPLLPLATALLCGIRAVPACAQSAAEQTSAEVFTDATGETVNTRIYLPPGMSADRKWPIVLFLHGAGERGTNNVSQLKHGVEALIRYGKNANDPAILLVPQCPANAQWVAVPWNAPAHTQPDQPSRPLRLALALLRSKIESLPVDPARVYITGVSMGGYGTWDAIQRTPGLFAAAMPICGGGDTAMAPAITHIPIWTFHGDKDTAVPVERSRDMAKALEACGGKIQYREYPGAGHDVWTRTYNDADVLSWFFSQRRPPIPDKTLER